MKKSFLVLGLSLMLVGCFGLFDKEDSTQPVAVQPSEPEISRPSFETEIDTEDAFDKALDAVPADQVPRFVEVVDEIDADSVQAADLGEKQEKENDEDKASRAASEARAVAREEIKNGALNKGLDIRAYSDDLFRQVKGVRTALIYFTADDCADCSAWEAGIKAEASAFADRTTLIMMADINAETDLAQDLRVETAGQVILLTGIGEIMGPMPGESMDKEKLLFIFR